jgi:hypothetical protein
METFQVQNKECYLLGETHTLKCDCFRFKISSTGNDSTSLNKACAVAILTLEPQKLGRGGDAGAREDRAAAAARMRWSLNSPERRCPGRRTRRRRQLGWGLQIGGSGLVGHRLQNGESGLSAA